MKLTRVDISGFKSFADPVSFELGGGITGFVGPNGCGKSNVVDAIRWALGEQSAKSLRGKEMLDVIFNGCATREAAGMSEVTLTFDNADQRLAIPQAEVAVTRRLLRSGESEYLVNREPCRLRDIKELFYDTGVCVDAYSVIEQGKVDRLLHANAQERREIFEEAAGISRYRAKVKLAVSRLERVDQNLERIRDLVRELDRQLKSIKRQAARARRSRELRDEHRALRTKVLAHRKRQLAAEREAILSERGQLDAELSAARAAVAALEQELRAIGAEREKAEGACQERRVELARIETEVRSISGSAAEAQARRIEDEKGIELARARESGAREEAAKAEAEARERLAALPALEEALRGAEAELAAREREAASVQDRIAEALRQAEALKSQEMEALVEQVRIEGERLAREREREGLLARSARLREQRAGVEAKVSHGDERCREAETRLVMLSEGRTHLLSKAEYYRKESARLLAEEESERASVEVLRFRMRTSEAERDAARELAARVSASSGGQTLGTLRGLLRASAGHTHAIDSALGRHAGDWVVRSTDGALSLIDRASASGVPEMGVFPMDRGGKETARPAIGFGESGVIGWAADLVEAADEVRPVVASLLSDTIVVEDRRTAMALLVSRVPFARLVTLSGEIYEQSGAIAYRTEWAADAVPVRKATVEEAEREVMRLSSELEQREAHRASVRARREEAERIAEATAAELASHDGETARAREEHDRSRVALDQLLREMEILRAEADSAEREAATLAASAGASAPAAAASAPSAAEAESQAQRKTELEREWGAADERCRAARAAAELSRAECERARSAAASAEEASRRFAEEAGRAAQDLAALEQRLSRVREDLDRLLRRRDEIGASTGGIEAALAEAAARSEALRAGAEAKAAEVQLERERERAAEGRLTELRMREQEAGLRMEEIAQRAAEELGGELDETVELAPGEDLEALARRADELKRELERTGGVDLEALSEEEELDRRHSFLKAQEEDLARAREGLTDLIQRMNRTSRQRFTETFDKVKVTFQETFRRLFGGGKADVVLEEGTDVLEAGIEVIARPPGKEPQSISLLSGGEKSLTAVALLFSVFQTRPSPFCILDEADAALDERNVDRFADILKEFLGTTQFLVITHNKRTMRIADRLYGVTQQEAGVSIPVALRFEELPQ